MKVLFQFILINLICSSLVIAQRSDSLIISQIFTNALTDTIAYGNLRYLCENMPGRLCGSENANKAVDWSAQVLKEYGADTVYFQDLMVKNWKRGNIEEAYFVNNKGDKVFLRISSFGLSVATNDEGLLANVLEVSSVDELKQLPLDSIKGKIVFYNKVMNQGNYFTFRSYSELSGFRFSGVTEASRMGAAGVLVRSSSLNIDTFPHTGVMRYAEGINKIPGIAIATYDAELLSSELKESPSLKLFLKTNCKTYPDVASSNVIAEIRGSKYPEKIMLVGGHIDCWDNSQGAHDDGAGCIQAMEVIRIFRDLNIKPENTIRVVLFMDEEVAQRGAIKYAETVKEKNENHIVAIESDRGAASPFGFTIDADSSFISFIQSFRPLLINYGLYFFEKGFSGVDISFLKEFNIPLMGLQTDSQRYFDYHHSANDSFDKINRRELQLGSAAITSIIYLIDKYETNNKQNN